MSTNHVENLRGMIGRHPLMLEVYRRARKVATAELPVLIIGETGTGKELVARAIHALSARGPTLRGGQLRRDTGVAC